LTRHSRFLPLFWAWAPFAGVSSFVCSLFFIHENDFKNALLSIFLTYVPLPGGNNNK